MNNERPSEREIEKEINSHLTIDLPEGELYDIVQSVDEFCQQSYSAGTQDGNDKGYQNGKRDAFDDVNKVEEVCSNFVVTKFSDCKTLEDFTSVFNEIRNRSFNFMT